MTTQTGTLRSFLSSQLLETLGQWSALETERLSLEAQHDLLAEEQTRLLDDLTDAEQEILLRHSVQVDDFAITGRIDRFGKLTLSQYPTFSLHAHDDAVWDSDLAKQASAVLCPKGWSPFQPQPAYGALFRARVIKVQLLLILLDNVPQYFLDAGDGATRSFPYGSYSELPGPTEALAQLQAAPPLHGPIAMAGQPQESVISATSRLLQHYRRQRWDVVGWRCTRVMHIGADKVSLTLDFTGWKRYGVSVQAHGYNSVRMPFVPASPPTAADALRYLAEHQPGCHTTQVLPAPVPASLVEPVPLDDIDLDSLFSQGSSEYDTIDDALRKKSWHRVGYGTGQYEMLGVGFLSISVDALETGGYIWSALFRLNRSDEDPVREFEDTIDELHQLPRPEEINFQREALEESAATAGCSK